jgi:hypothetical protein
MRAVEPLGAAPSGAAGTTFSKNARRFLAMVDLPSRKKDG